MASVLFYCTQFIKIYKQQAVLLLFLLFFFLPRFSFSQTNYYYDGSGALSSISNWGVNTDGSGTAPSNFTANSQIFNIRNTASVSLTTTWTVSGTGSQVVVNNGTTLFSGTGSNFSIGASTKLVINNGGTLQSDVAITINSSGTLQVDNGGTYMHNNTTATSSSIFQGTESFGASSNVRIDKWNSVNTAVDNAVTLPFGNLEINWTANTGAWQQGWSTTFTLCAGNFKITSTGSGSFAYTTKNAFTISVSGNYIVNGGTIDIGTANGAKKTGDINVDGDITQTAGTYVQGGNAMELRLNATGTGTNTWTFSGGTRYLMYYTIASGKTINLASNFNMGSGLSSTQVLLITGTLDAATYIISYGTASQGVTNNGTLKTANTNGLTGNSSTTISNTVSLTLNHGTNSTIEYNASGSQNVTATTAYENVIINGSGTKTLQGASTINKALTLTSGKLDIQNYVLTIPSTGSVASYTSSNYIITGNGAGRLRQEAVTSSNYNTTKYFPIGTASCYLPVAANPTATSDFTANVFTGATTNGLSGGTAWTSPQKKGMVDAVWNVERKSDRIAISGTAVNTFKWDNCYGSLEGTDFAAAANSSIGIWRWVSGTSWSLSSTNFTSDNSNGNNASTNNTSATYPGPYIVAIITSPLAVYDVLLKGSLKNKNDVVLDWNIKGNITAGTLFDAERSLDNIHFVKFNTLYGNGAEDYSITDAGVNSRKVYYRIKVIDKTGNYKYSNIISIITNADIKINLLTNPVISQAVLLHPAAANTHYRIINLEGKIILKGTIPNNSSQTYIDVSKLDKAVYILQFISEDEVKSLKLIKQ